MVEPILDSLQVYLALVVWNEPVAADGKWTSSNYYNFYPVHSSF